MSHAYPGYDHTVHEPDLKLGPEGWRCYNPLDVVGLALFSDDEIRWMQYVVKRETERLRSQGRVNTTSFHPVLNQQERDLVALMGEYGVAKHFGLDVSDCDIAKNGVTPVNRDYDLILPTQPPMKASVKSIDIRKRANLPICYAETDVERPFLADCGVIVAVYRPRMAIVRGWFTREDWQQHSYVSDRFGSYRQKQANRKYDDRRARPFSALLAMRKIRCCECGGTDTEPRGLCSGVLHDEIPE